MKVILFDLDGTLIDSTEAILDGFKFVFEKNRLEPPKDEEIKRLIGLPLEIMFEKLGVKKNIEKFVDLYKRRYREIFKEKTILLPNVKEALKEARFFAKLAIVTTKTGVYSRELLKYFEILDFFEVVIGREDVLNPKPHPEPILRAIHIIKANKEATFMVGDTCLDMLSAKEAGVMGVGVEFIYEDKAKLLKCSDILKKDVLEAVRFIKNFKTSGS